MLLQQRSSTEYMDGAAEMARHNVFLMTETGRTWHKMLLLLVQSYLWDFQQVSILVDSNVTQVFASAQLAPDLLQVLCQVCLCILHPSLSIVKLLVHPLCSTQTCCTVITQPGYDRPPAQDAMIASLASCNAVMVCFLHHAVTAVPACCERVMPAIFCIMQ